MKIYNTLTRKNMATSKKEDVFNKIFEIILKKTLDIINHIVYNINAVQRQQVRYLRLNDKNCRPAEDECFNVIYYAPSTARGGSVFVYTNSAPITKQEVNF